MFSAALHISRTLRRVPKFLPVAALVAACALLGASQARPVLLDSTSTLLNMSATTIPIGGSVTLTATVTGTTAPGGNIQFTSQQSGGTLNLLGTVTLSPINATQSQATFTAMGFSAGSYTMGARFRTSDSIAWSNSNAPGSILTVQSVVVHNTAMTLSTNPATVNQGDFTTLSAAVVETDGGGLIPTGVVSFHTSGVGGDTLLGTAPLDASGTATLPTGPWLAGAYTIVASYEGDAFDHSAGAQLPLTVGNGGTAAKDTTTTIIASPVSIHSGDVVTLDANVLQTGTPLHPPAGDAVEFLANGVFIGQTDLDSTGHAIITIGGWLSGNYTIEADYVGNLFFNGSAGQTTLSVSDPQPTTTSYTGDTTTLYGAPVTLKAVLTDNSTGLPLVGKTVAISVASGIPGLTPLTCTGTTDNSGYVQCSTTMTLQPGSYPIAAAFAGEGAYLPSGDNNTMVVSPLHTTTTAGSLSTTTGTPTTLTSHLVDQFGNPLPAGTPVMLSIAGHSESCSGMTDASGNVSCVITPSEGAGSYTINATFAGINESDGVTPIYLGSSGNGTMTIVGGIPTSITYTGVTKVQQGSTAHVSFVLRNANTNAVLGNQPVTVTFDGGTYSLTTDSNGVMVISPDATVNDPAGSNLPATASFAGATPYLGSNGAGNVYVTSPTTLTYTGPSVVTEGSNGGNTTISFVLKDGLGNVLAGKSVSLAFGSQTCNNLISGANGSVSCVVTTPAPGQPGGYTPTASFAGDSAYGSSTGTGSFIVVAPTSLSYTGDTTGTRGGIATLKGVLTDSVTGLPLAGRTVTWTIGSGPTAQTCTAVTDATGLASCTVTLAQNVSPTPYAVSGSFAGTAYYSLSSAAGALTMAPTVLTVTADNKSISQGDAIPPLTYTVAGFVNGDTLATSDVTGIATCTTTATSSSPVGSYPIVCTIGSLTSTNYTFRFVAGQLSILPATTCTGLFNNHKCESVLADPSPAQGAQVTPGQTMQVVYMDDSPMPAGGATVSLNGQLIPVTVTTTSGYPQNYVDNYNGSMSTKYESMITFQVPASLANGQYSFIVTVFDGDGDGDQWSWNVGVGMLGAGGGTGGTGGTIGSATSMNLTDPAPFLLANKSVTVSATLTSGGKALANEPVTLTFSSDDSSATDVTCTAKTTRAGLASCALTPKALGTGDLIATFAGDKTYAGSADGTEVTIVAAYPSTLAFGTIPALQVGKAASIPVTLTSNGAPLANATITFTVSGQTLTAKTNASGVATCSGTPTVAGTYNLTASFAGDATHAATSVSQSVTVAPK
jgi:hypothetical protein